MLFLFLFVFLFISILFFAPHVVPDTLPHPNPHCVSDRAGQQPPHQMIDYFPQNKKNCINGATSRSIVKYCSFEWFLGWNSTIEVSESSLGHIPRALDIGLFGSVRNSSFLLMRDCPYITCEWSRFYIDVLKNNRLISSMATDSTCSWMHVPSTPLSWEPVCLGTSQNWYSPRETLDISMGYLVTYVGNINTHMYITHTVGQGKRYANEPASGSFRGPGHFSGDGQGYMASGSCRRSSSNPSASEELNQCPTLSSCRQSPVACPSVRVRVWFRFEYYHSYLRIN